IAKGGAEYDFAVAGNAFFNVLTGDGGSNEPGIVYVMQDVNGNGLPDDEWYELRGSETGKPETIHDYAVTYYRPSAPRMNVQWTDNLGASGTIDYLADYHTQNYYYPAWITDESYTLSGTRLESRVTMDSSTGYWELWKYDRGYVDNMGSDVVKAISEGQRNGFKIANAMYANQTAVNLKYIDFIKVQTGVNAKAGWLGEVSTEVIGFEDLNMSER
ncbi:MAG: cell surface protein, partial [Muribaculaceae bacterium]|nr:cell surface protein [Muribaculaceae bacterium]